MKKRKTIKKITFSALALVMATAGILAFAPMGASASETTTTGLDPIVYTTDSDFLTRWGLPGLEMKLQ